MGKNNISYYSHKVESHNHWKFKALRRVYKWDGEGKFWALNNMIAEADGCKLDISTENRKKAIAVELDFNSKEFEEYINFLASECELIHYSDGFIMTDTTQEILSEINEKREKERERKAYKKTFQSKNVTENKKGEAEITDFQPESKDGDAEKEQSKVNKSKVNKSKVNKSKEEDSLVGEAPTPQKNLLEKQEKMKIREKEFYASLIPFSSAYPKDMLRSFFNYWKEPNKSRTRMKFEMEETWDLKLRLLRWEKNNYKFDKNPKSNDPPSLIENHKSEYQKAIEKQKEELSRP
jgi:hypothetical protein